MTLINLCGFKVSLLYNFYSNKLASEVWMFSKLYNTIDASQLGSGGDEKKKEWLKLARLGGTQSYK